MKSVLGLENPVSKAIYEKSICTAEKMTEIINTFFVKILFQIIMLETLIGNYYVYFFMDAEEDTFQWSLIFPYWYVFDVQH